MINRGYYLFIFMSARKLRTYILPLLFLLLHVTGYAQPRLSGGVFNYNGVQVSSPHELLYGYNRLNLILEQQVSDGRLYADVDFEHLYSEAADSLRVLPRQVWMELYFDNSDLRAGRQLINWGLAEGSSVWEQTSRMDLSRLFTDDFSRVRLGTDALRYIYYSGSNQIEGIINPVFSPHIIPDSESIWFPYIPIPGDLDTEIQHETPSPSLDRIQYGFRFRFRGLNRADLDLNALYWHNPTPAYFKQPRFSSEEPGDFELPEAIVLTETYHQTPIFGFALEVRPAPDWDIFTEAAWHLSRKFDLIPEEIEYLDRETITIGELNELIDAIEYYQQSGFLTERPWLNSTLGIRYRSGNRVMKLLSGIETIINYHDEIAQDQVFTHITALYSDYFFRDRLNLNVTGRYHLNDQSFWLTPSLSYEVTDRWDTSVGTHIFGGHSPEPYYGHLSFHQFSEYSFGYLELRYRW